jgi:glucose-1-phosphate thymidylyltransferase
MKGILLAAGTGSRLSPLTIATSKHLLPVHDKPMIYYPISTLILAGVRELAVVVNPEHLDSYKRLLGSGDQWGMSITYVEQKLANGLPDAISAASSFLGGHGCAVALGDNIFHGAGMGTTLKSVGRESGAVIFAHKVANPSEYGVIELDESGAPLGLTEKPQIPKSNLAVPGLYFFDQTVIERVGQLKPSERGELEITDLLASYLKEGVLEVRQIERGTAWFDAGTVDSLSRATEFVRVIQERQGTLIGSPDEASWRVGNISRQTLEETAQQSKLSRYGELLISALRSW